MGEDDIMELIWKRDQIVSSSPTQRPTSVPPILRGSGSGGDVGEGENAPVPPPPPPREHHQNLFIHEDEMAAWLHHQDDFFSHLLYSGVAASQPQSSISLAPPPPPTSRAENFTNFARLRGNILTGAGPLIPVSRESTQVDSSATSSVTESCQTPATAIGGVSQTFAKEVAIKTVYEVAGTSSSAVCKAVTEPIQIQPAIETDENRKRKEREEPEETEEAGGSRKRSRAAEMHNSAERRRRGKINERMKALQELIPRCNKSDKASMLEDAIEYVKSLQLQIQMMSMGGGAMPMMYTPDMQRFMLSQMAMGMMDMNRPPLIPFHGTPPFPRQVHMAGLCPPYPFPASDPSRIHIPTSQQPDPVSNQPQFSGYLNPYYTQFAGLQQMQQPPPLQNRTTSQPSFGQASSSREPEDQENQPTVADPSKSQFEDN